MATQQVELIKLQSSKQAIEQQIDALHIDRQKVEHQVQSLQAHLAATQRQHTDLQSKTRELDEQLQARQSEQAHLVQSHTRDMNKLTQDKKTMSAEMVTLTEQLNALLTSVDELTAQRRRLEASLQTDSNAKMQLKDSTAVQQEALDQLQQQYTKLQAALHATATDQADSTPGHSHTGTSRVVREIIDNSATLQKLHHSISQQRVIDAELKCNIQIQQSKLDFMVGDCNKAERQVSEGGQQMSVLNDELTSKQAELKQVLQQLSLTTTRQTDAQRALQALDSKQRQQQSSMAAQQNDAAQSQMELQRLKDRIEVETQQLHVLEWSRAQCDTDVHQLQRRAMQLEQQCAEYTHKLSNDKSQCARVATELAALQQRRSKMSSQVDRLTQEVAELQAGQREQQAVRDALQQQVMTLQKEKAVAAI